MIQPKFRFFVTLNTTTVEVHPYEFSKTKFIEEQVPNQVFFREKLKGNLVFLNVQKDGVADFDLFWAIERGTSATFPGASQCTTFDLEIRKLCGNEYVTRWTGRFSTGGGKWDIDNCKFEVQPDVVDRYSCLMDHMDIEMNMLYGGTRYEAGGLEGTLQVLQHWTTEVDEGAGFTLEFERVRLDGVSVLWADQDTDFWCLETYTVDEHRDHDGSTIRNVYARYTREIITSTCTGAVPDSPGVTWSILEDNCPIDSVWWRCSYGDYEYGNLCMLNEVIDRFMILFDCGLEYTSIFFDWNPDITDPFYALTSGGVNNYVTMVETWVDQLMIAQKRDIKIPFASNPGSIAMVKFKKLMEDLRCMFNVYMDVTETGDFLIEHIKYFRNQNSAIDLRVAGVQFNKRKNEYEHLKTQIPRKEWFRFMESSPSGYGDWADAPIIYSDVCSLENLEVSNSADDITTNLQYIADYPEDIDDSGFCIIATKYNGTIYALNFEAGLLSGTVRVNAHLSWANLLYNFHRYERYLPNGIMNEVDETFFTWKPNIKQVQLSLPHCCDDPEFNAEELFDTALGQLFGGKKGHVESAEHPNDNSELINIIFKYSI